MAEDPQTPQSRVFERLRDLPHELLVVELERRHYEVEQAPTKRSVTLIGVEELPADPPNPRHFPDDALLAEAKRRGLKVAQNRSSPLDG